MTVGTDVTGPTVLTVGEALVGYCTTEPALRTATNFERFLGGAELNVAVGLTRLGTHTTWASVLGDDAHGDFVTDRLDQLGVDRRVRRVPGQTALMFKAGVGSDDPEILQVRRHTAFARHAPSLLDPGLLSLRGIDHLHLTGITLGLSKRARQTVLGLLDEALAAGCTVSFDPNLRLNLWRDQDRMRAVVNEVAARASVVLPGLAEGRLLTGHTEARAIADFYLSRGAGEVVVKLGSPGAEAWSADGEHARARHFPVRPVDTVGAGDGFAAGYLASLLAGQDLAGRVDRAAAVGALVTTRRGDLDAMPSTDEVGGLMRATGRA